MLPPAMSRCKLALIALPFALACGKTEVRGKGKPAPTQAQSSEKAEARPPIEPKPGPTPPHQSLTDPHQGVNPHAAPAAKPKGPPQDVTPSGETQPASLAELELAVPVEWKKGHPRSTMRLAEFAIPGPGGDAELVVFRFAGGAGGVEANVDRWKQQFKPPEGKSIDDVTTITKREQGNLAITLVDVRGHYVAEVMPGADAKHDEEGYRMLAAIVEGSGDAFFFKTVGPAKTLDVWSEAHEAMLTSMKASS
jgi:hypothetical protein